MSINLLIYHNESVTPKFYPFSSVSKGSMWDLYWKPMTEEHNLQWLNLMKTVGIPFYKHLDQLGEIRQDFQTLYDLTNALTDIKADYKNRMLTRINLVIEIIDKMIVDPNQFEKVSIG